MLRFRCSRCGCWVTAAKEDDVPGRRHSAVNAFGCIEAMGEEICKLAKRIEEIEKGR